MAAAILSLLLVVHGAITAPERALPDKRLTGVAISLQHEEPEAIPSETGTSDATPPPAPPPAPPSGSVWDQLAGCEANSDPAKGPTGWATTTTGNGYYFALQFSPGTWLANGGTQEELDAADRGVAPSRARLIEVGQNVLDSQGPDAWPNCWPG